VAVDDFVAVISSQFNKQGIRSRVLWFRHLITVRQSAILEINVLIPIRRLPGSEDILFPTYESVGAAGMDVRAAVKSTLELQPGRIALVPCGFAIALPPGFEAQIRPRSGLATKCGITVVNSPGTIDSDYRGNQCWIDCCDFCLSASLPAHDEGELGTC
jgi:hypothetical protein